MGVLEDAGIQTRDRLLDAIVGRLRQRKDTGGLADQIEKLSQIIRKIERPTSLRDGDGNPFKTPPAEELAARLTEVSTDRIEIFRARRRWEREPSGLQSWKSKWETATRHFEIFHTENRSASREQWAAEIETVWTGTLKQRTALPRKMIDEVLVIKAPASRALKLVHAAAGRRDDPSEFRRQLTRVIPKLWP